MRLAFSWTAMTIAVACSNGPVSVHPDAGTPATPSACTLCASNTCIDAWRACAAEPSCSEALRCAYPCSGKGSDTCVQACAPAAPEAHEAWERWRRCFVDNGIRECPTCGGRSATYTNPLLKQECTGQTSPDWPSAVGECRDCTGQKCCTTTEACKAGSECAKLLLCAAPCKLDFQCELACVQQHPTGLQPLSEYYACSYVHCGSECSLNSGACDECTTKQCGDEFAAFMGTPDGFSYRYCLLGCPQNMFLPCVENCAKQYPKGASSAAIVDLCKQRRCPDICI